MDRIAASTAWMGRHEAMRHRAAGIVLVSIIHLLGFLLLLSLAPQTFQRPKPELKSFPLHSYSERIAAKRAARSDAPRRRTEPVAHITAPPPVPQLPANMILMSSAQFHASDIAAIHPQRAEGRDNGGAGSELAEGPGEGPGGEKLYPADWYREPTPAEMAFYLKDNHRAGWGMIACRTIPDYRVEDCRELGESPAGSGLASALRQAAWQFRIRPPRLGGKPQMGVWVRIVLDSQVGVVRP